jgi:hypothetical protein
MMKESPFEKLVVAQLFKKFSAFYETRSIIRAFTGARHWTILIQINLAHLFAPYLFKFHFNITLPSTIRS